MTAQHRPVIGITAFRRSLPTPLGERTDLYTLDPAYADRVAEAGGLPVLLPHGDDPQEVLDLVHGLVLSGGGDIHPSRYGDADAGNLEDLHEGADRWELELILAARRRGAPVLGICRGMQALAVAMGGRLAQELDPDAPHPPLPSGADAILAARHDVALAEGSRVAGMLGGTRVPANSIHHQRVVDAGSLAVVGTAGGVIEAVEATGGWLAVGVQWHPEKMHEPEQRGLFAALVEAAARA